MMAIQYSEVFPLLATSVTGVEADDEDRKEPTPYFFLSDMIRFVCRRAESGSFIEAEQLGALLSKLQAEGDDDVQDLVSDGLDALSGRPAQDEIVRHFSPSLMTLWKSRTGQ
jgi:hypothetical protein